MYTFSACNKTFLMRRPHCVLFMLLTKTFVDKTPTLSYYCSKCDLTFILPWTYWVNICEVRTMPNHSTQQNSYSISHLLGTVTTQWLPLWRCSHCSLVPDTVTTVQWLHRTHTLLGIPYCGTYVEICLLGT